MFGEFKFDEVADQLWVGPSPSSPERIQSIKTDAGATGLVSVQTDEDLSSTGMSWDLMWNFLMRQGISVTRVPIVDFDDNALVAGLSQAVAAVEKTIGAGRTTYLHCTAGLNRSPSVAITYLVTAKGLPLDDAWEQVTSRHDCAPRRKALDRWVSTRSS